MRNREGEAVDPVPFLVVAGLGVMCCLSAGPIYLRVVLATDWATGIAVSAACSLAIAAGAWYRLVWTFSPVSLETVPAETRFRRLVVGMVALAGLLVLLLIPVVAP